MKYKMLVTIANPNTPKGMFSDILKKLSCEFSYNPKDYGNGHYLAIFDEHGFKNCIDLRYDKTFHKDRKEEYLKQWANNYWNGQNGAYIVKSIEITAE